MHIRLPAPPEHLARERHTGQKLTKLLLIVTHFVAVIHLLAQLTVIKLEPRTPGPGPVQGKPHEWQKQREDPTHKKKVVAEEAVGPEARCAIPDIGEEADGGEDVGVEESEEVGLAVDDVFERRADYVDDDIDEVGGEDKELVEPG